MQAGTYTADSPTNGWSLEKLEERLALMVQMYPPLPPHWWTREFQRVIDLIKVAKSFEAGRVYERSLSE